MINENEQIKTSSAPPRNSAIELLRILSMIMIIFHHFSAHSGFVWDNMRLSVPFFWDSFISMGGKIGVNVFVLISGYFLVNSQKSGLDFKRILKFWGEVFFYSVLIFIILVSIGDFHFSVLSVLRVFLPITYARWWFASTYFVLYLIHPFLNVLLRNLDRRAYQSLLILAVICWSILPTLFDVHFEGSNLLWFMTLYAISGYIRIYGLNFKFQSKHYFILFALFAVLTYALCIVSIATGIRRASYSPYESFFYAQEKLSVLLTSVSLFAAFANLKMKYHKWINVVASATFGVYLLHDHSLVRPYLWVRIFHCADYQNSLLLIPYSIAVVLAVFVICTLMDLLRQQTVERLYMKAVNRYADTVLKPFKKVCEFFKRLIFGKQETSEEQDDICNN